jgi:hypothetical protein
VLFFSKAIKITEWDFVFLLSHMKIGTYILAFMVILLSAKPGIDAITLSSVNQPTCYSSSKCHLTSDHNNPENQNDPQDEEMCNPFQACGSCLLHFVTTPYYPSFQSYISTEEFFGYQSFIASQYIFDFWQPPQFV